MTKARNIADIGSNDVLDTDAVGLTVSGDLTVADSYPDFKIQDTDGSDQFILMQQVGGASMFKFQSGTNDGELYFTGGRTGVNKMKIATSGDIIMYKDDGTTAGMTFDASAGSIDVNGPLKIGGTTVIDGSRNVSNVEISKLRTSVSSVYVSPQNANTFNGGYDQDTDEADLWINYRGYLDGFSRFRDTRIGNGKGAALVHVDGSAASVNFSSNIGINEAAPDRQLHITDASEVNLKLEAGSDTTEIRLKDSDNALTVHLNNNERMGLKSNEVNWTNSTNGFYNKIWGPSSGDIASGYLTYRGSTLRGGFYTNPSHGLTIISEVDISFRANNANRLHIDTSGRVTTPYQPYVFVEKDADQTLTSNENPITFESSRYNSGNHFNLSTNSFTAPVAGRYAVDFVATCTINANHLYNAIYINYNGTEYMGVRSRVTPSVATANEWSSFNINAVIYMAANDSFNLRGYSNHSSNGPTLSSGETNLIITLLG